MGKSFKDREGYDKSAARKYRKAAKQRRAMRNNEDCAEFASFVVRMPKAEDIEQVGKNDMPVSEYDQDELYSRKDFDKYGDNAPYSIPEMK